MGKKKKYYVVWEGHRPGIYDNWNDCQSQVTGYPGARYQSFKTREAAERAYEEGPGAIDHTEKKVDRDISEIKEVVLPSWSVDAACSGNPGDLEYRGVDTETGQELFRLGPFAQGTNNIGEFLALVHAIALLKQKGKSNLPIYSDSRTAIKWVKDKKANTKLKQTHKNKKIFLLIARAEQWLKSHDFNNSLLKWNTKEWGEIPADFGRK